MAKRIVITGDSSQLRQDFEQTAQNISGSLDKLGNKTQALSLTGKQRAEYLKQEARNTNLPQIQQRGKENIKRLEQDKTENRDLYLSNRKEILDNKKLSPEQRKSKLAEILQERKGADDEADGKIGQESERIKSAEQVQRGLAELTRQLKLQETLQRSRHNEWSQLTKKELDAKTKEIEEKMRKTTDPDELEELKRDQQAIRRIKNDKEGPEDKRGLTDFIKRLTGLHFLAQGAQQIGNTVGNTTGEAVGVGMNGLQAGALLAVPTIALGVIGMMLKKGKELETARDGLNTFNANGNVKDFGKSEKYENVGFDQIEFINLAAQVAKSRGSGEDLEERTRQQIMLRKGLGLDDGELSGLNSMAHVGVENPTEAITKLLGVLSRSALVNLSADKFDVSALPHYLEKLVQLDQRSIEKTGRANNSKNADLLGTVMGMGGIFKDFRTAGSTVNSLQEQFSSQEPVKRYYNQQAILKAHPEMEGNMVAVKREMENPDAKSTAAMINSTRERSEVIVGKYTGKGGVIDDFILQNLQDNGLGTYTKAFEYMQNGGKMSAQMAGNAGVDLEGRSIKNTGTFDHIEAGLVNKIAQPGQGMIEAFNKAFEIMRGGADLSDIVDAVKGIDSSGKPSGLSNFLQNKGSKTKPVKARRPSGAFKTH